MTSSPTPPGQTPLAGGAILGVLPIIGAVAGLFAGQPTIGFLIGLAIGIAVAVAIWLKDRR